MDLRTPSPLDPRIIALYDEYTHRPLPRRVFMQRLAELAGGAAAAVTLLPLLDNNYALAALVDEKDKRLASESITWKGSACEMRGYLARAKAGAKKRGAVIVLHENRGLNAHIMDVARRAALAGFTALAPDLLSPLGGTPANEDEARAGFGKLDREQTVANLVATVAELKRRKDANGRVGIVGFCWGGGMANALATRAPDLAAAAPFYGSAPPAADVPNIKAKLMLHYAGNDTRINGGIADYETALNAAKVSYQKFVYEGVDHAFHNDTAGARYNQAAAELAWSRTMAFFKANLKG